MGSLKKFNSKKVTAELPPLWSFPLFTFCTIRESQINSVHLKRYGERNCLSHSATYLSQAKGKLKIPDTVDNFCLWFGKHRAHSAKPQFMEIAARILDNWLELLPSKNKSFILVTDVTEILKLSHSPHCWLAPLYPALKEWKSTSNP